MFSARFLFITALLGGLWFALAWAATGPDTPSGDHITERGWLKDPAGNLQRADVEQQTFQPFKGPLSHGNDDVAIWLRLVVPATPDRESLVLVLQPATIRDIQIHTRTEDGHWQSQQMGLRFPYTERLRRELSFSLPITVGTAHPTVMYVRIQSPTAILHVRALTADASRDFDTTLHMVVGLYMGLALVLMSLSVAMWWSTRDSLWGIAAAFDLATMIQVSLPLGLFAKYVAPSVGEWLPTAFAVSGSMHLTLACLLFAKLLTALQASRWVVLGYYSVVMLLPVWLLLISLGQLTETARWINLSVLAISLWGITGFVTVGTPDKLLRWLYRALVGPLIIYLLYWALPTLRTGEASQLNIYPTLPSNLFTMIMVVLMLVRRTWLEAQSRQILEQEARESAQRLTQEQEKHAETASFLGMLMHEIKNPLASISMASELLSTGRTKSTEEQGRRFKNIQDSVESINTVLQRCLDMDRLERGALQIEKSNYDIAQLIKRWIVQHSQVARIHDELPESLIAETDTPLFFLMLSNLVDNALKYSPADTIIELRLLNSRDRMVVEVRNPVGKAGMPDPDKLFQKYYRSPQAQRDSGTGLGLYWVYRVARMLGGGIQYYPDGNKVVFALSLPL